MNDTQRLIIALCRFPKGERTPYGENCPYVYERTKHNLYFQKADINALFVTKKLLRKGHVLCKKVNSDVIKLYETSQVKLKISGNTREVQFKDAIKDNILHPYKGGSGSTDYYVGPNGKALPSQYKDWIGTNID